MKKSKVLNQYVISSGGKLSNFCLSLGIYDFEKLAFWLKALPYGRTKSRTDLTQLFTEGKGTCSTKHGLFKSVAIENGFTEFKLIIGLFKMNSRNTPGIKDALSNTTFDYIPEAHTYIRFNQDTLDLTNENSSFEKFKSDILKELEIEPYQIGQFKVDYHKKYLKDWINNQNTIVDFETLWEIRELCISNLSS